MTNYQWIKGLGKEGVVNFIYALSCDDYITNVIEKEACESCKLKDDCPLENLAVDGVFPKCPESPTQLIERWLEMEHKL